MRDTELTDSPDGIRRVATPVTSYRSTLAAWHMSPSRFGTGVGRVATAPPAAWIPVALPIPLQRSATSLPVYDMQPYSPPAPVARQPQRRPASPTGRFGSSHFK